LIKSPETLGCHQFGRELLRTNDLDPVYVVLHRARLPTPDLCRWLLAYWCFYHAGTACVVAAGKTGYWERMTAAASSSSWPRCRERRHFRAENARKSVEWLRSRGVSALFGRLITAEGETVNARDLMDYVETWVGFGPWVAFKVADMVERLGLADVHFDPDTVMYDSPRKGAECLWLAEAEGKVAYAEEFIPEDVGNWAADRILRELSGLTAPPRHERPVGLQEAETILCKWHSYVNGHYRLGEDVEGLRAALGWAGKNWASRKMVAAGAAAGLWRG
jgi:hypothetical protein